MKKFILHTLKGNSMIYYKTIEADYFTIESRHIKIIKDNSQISHFPARYFSIEEVIINNI
jgi:hypothetical protein